MEVVRDLLAKQLLRTTPRLRVRLSTSLYKEFAHIMFPEKVQEALLWKMGVLRQRADEVQIWCADEPLQDSTMALLLDYARRFCEIAEARSFQVHMEGETPLVLKLQGVKKEDVRKVVERRWRLFSQTSAASPWSSFEERQFRGSGHSAGRVRASGQSALACIICSAKSSRGRSTCVARAHDARNGLGPSRDAPGRWGGGYLPDEGVPCLAAHMRVGLFLCILGESGS